MTNPFDEALSGEEEKQENFQKEDREQKRPEKDKISISLSLNRRSFERLFYIAIILSLVGVILLNPLCRCSIVSIGKDCEITSSAKVTEKTADETSDVKAEKEETIVEEETEETIVEEETEETKKETLPFGENFDLNIEDVDYVRDPDENDKPVKIKSITFSMTNNWGDFNPRIKVYWYDKDSTNVIKESVRATHTYRTVKKGTTVKYTVREFDSVFFDPQNREETIVLKMFDADDDSLKKTDSISIS